MSNLLDRTRNIRLLDRVILLCLFVVSLVLTVLFWRHSFVYDASGHVALVENIKSHFWPLISGWDSTNLLGWPQGIFYPSLFHWLAAALAFITGVETSVKILIGTSLLLLPSSIFSFARTISRERAGFLTILIFGILAASPNYLGTGIASLFQIGLLSNFFALPLFFLFLTAVNKNKALWSGVFLALLILTHLVAALAAVGYLISLTIAKYLKERKIHWVFCFKSAAIALILSSFFWIPFVLNFSYTSVSRHISSYLLPNVVLLIISIIAAFWAWKQKNTTLLTLSIFSWAVTKVAVIDAYLISQEITSPLYGIHFYRFQPFAYVLLVATLLTTFLSFPTRLGIDPRFRGNDKLITAGLLVLLIAGLIVKNPTAVPAGKLEITKPELVSGRFLEMFRRSDVDPYWYGFQYSLVRKNPNSQWAYGLFTDSSPNGPFLGSLIKSLRPDNYPEGEGRQLETKLVDSRRLSQLLDLFSINYLINFDKVSFNSVGTLEKNGQTYFFNALKASNSPLFEVVKYKLKPISENWDREVEKWWLEKGEIQELPYLSKGEKFSDFSASLENAKVEIVSSNQEQTEFKLKIIAATPVPVLAKISYFPAWKAVQDGKELQIYRVAPNLMMIIAAGEISLKY